MQYNKTDILTVCILISRKKGVISHVPKVTLH